MTKYYFNDDGTIIYRNENGFYHREDGPALIHSDGTKSWYNNGKYHREDGPAVVFPNGMKIWYKNGKRHREDGPALIYPDGVFFWYLSDTFYFFNEWLQVVNISDEEKLELILRYG